jgi:hypothetical protein
MAQANTDNSTSMPVDQTRRSFLAQAAGVAAGSAALALATIPPTQAAAAQRARIPTANVPVPQITMMMNLGYIIKANELSALGSSIFAKYNVNAPSAAPGPMPEAKP